LTSRPPDGILAAKLNAAPAALEGKQDAGDPGVGVLDVVDRANLYLGDRDTDQISFVSVLNDETAPPAGAYDWIGGFLNQGGTSADYTNQDQHAISADGKSIYFTAAGSGKLYLRTNPTQRTEPAERKRRMRRPHARLHRADLGFA
jgi:hypothetical protein